jgi:EAL domain-containing protein (putative c-di-GMP-specific phosphodiesterase class I)
VSPATVRSGRFKKAIGPSVAERVVLSVSDLAPGDRVGLEASLAFLRARGVRVAVTDVGSELAGLERLIRLSPEFVEVDEAITRGIHRDTSRHAVVAALASCAEQLGVHVVASGVTSKAQLEELGRLGARFVRGSFVSRVTQGIELGKGLGEGLGASVKSRSGGADDMSDGVPPSSIGGDG